ncbi:AAA domain-containing protein [Enterobacteriaceae bacterium H20N1]|uniref:AAA domain-containing protein n=1 Tax=Dryocola boscaweniae TaxID=2925397 RepID=A0A9X3AB48_9ENTR|nr:AAA domain-containing protein [Dryocola boscaweniae]MCT4702139.1 AAA domain-containing protein [Dryocola boscaweniae]MCT4714064.1 AAA domain-containing protein [Dryocola boscaweniae]MCT4719417.1 AAA domain-containing protein [Dryocola boscaweniae]
MVSVYMDGKEKTSQLKDWKLWYDDRKGGLVLSCIYHSGKKYNRPLEDCEIIPTKPEIGSRLIKKGNAEVQTIESAITYGGKYTVVYYPGNARPYCMKTSEIDKITEAPANEKIIFDYFNRVAQARVAYSSEDKKHIAESVVRQLNKVLPCHPNSVLHAYCTGKNQHRDPLQKLIYPFGINESQLQAVEQAFSSQISLIEGPPGTGKTQTILNIIANILLNNKSVAVLSNNNSAVDNVYEKLEKAGLNYLFARLGSSDNRKQFFSSVPLGLPEAPASQPKLEDIEANGQKLKNQLIARNKVAQLQADIEELLIEQKYLHEWQREQTFPASQLIKNQRLTADKATDLMAWLHYLAEHPVTLRDRLELLFRFRIWRIKAINSPAKRQRLIRELQLYFYKKTLESKKAELDAQQKILQEGQFETLLNSLTSASMDYLKNHLHQHITDRQPFDEARYLQEFDAFLARYPIIGSSTHSIINSLPTRKLIDFVIIDEASQQDILPGILALGCARNVIIVGDRKQLPHVPVKIDIPAPAEYYDCVRYSLLGSIVGIFEHGLPTSLLKEHYRCHPKIIQFCNKQFYDNQLIPMTQDKGEQSMSLIITAKGNHTRKFTNLRELESLGPLEWDEKHNRGFIAPYNAQINLSKKVLPEDFIKATVHKFQGRECDEIIFSTVLDKKTAHGDKIDFVDDPHLVNVAVSRAKNNFTLVTGDEVFTMKNRHIAALVRYIEYYADESQIQRAPVVSAFDLLYSEYDRSLQKLQARLNPGDSKFKSEQIIAALLRDLLTKPDYQLIKFHTQIPLAQLISLANNVLTAREVEFVNQQASCDFVLYFKVGKTPLGVIEVDGGYHETPEQAERDRVKDSVLGKSGVPLLRLSTVESSIEDKLAAFVDDCLNHFTEKHITDTAV